MAIIARLESQSVVGGKIVLGWGFYDPAGPFEQDGVTPRIFYREAMELLPAANMVALAQTDLLAIGARVAKAQTVLKALQQTVQVGFEMQVG